MADDGKQTANTLAEAQALGLGFIGTATAPSPLAYGGTLKGAVVNSNDPPLHGKQPEPEE